jgi:crotonobetainyl-CoA:carnitine CoA-transferase CaiB-like acyl-CoA transferase
VSGPLAGVKVLDFGAYFAGPYASRLLADLGADVVKLEPRSGDPMRPLVRTFAAAQRGKRGIAVDLKAPAGKEVARRLAAWADIVSHNLRPCVAERLGLGYAQVCEVNPQVVYLYSPGWGSTGPDARRQGFAPLYAGLVGVHHEVAGRGNPPAFPLPNEDYANGLLGAAASLMALVHRRRTGQGQYVESPQLNATLMLLMGVMRRERDGEVLGAGALDSRQLGTHPLHRLYRTADGWICVVAARAAQFAALCRALGLEEAATDPRFADAEGRRRHAAELGALLEPAFARLTSAQCVAALEGAGVPCELPRACGQTALFEDPAQRCDGRVVEYAHPQYKRLREIGRLVRVGEQTPGAGRPAPALGEHTREILGQLGYSGEQVAQLFARAVVA